MHFFRRLLMVLMYIALTILAVREFCDASISYALVNAMKIVIVDRTLYAIMVTKMLLCINSSFVNLRSFIAVIDHVGDFLIVVGYCVLSCKDNNTRCPGHLVCGDKGFCHVLTLMDSCEAGGTTCDDHMICINHICYPAIDQTGSCSDSHDCGM